MKLLIATVFLAVLIVVSAERDSPIQKPLAYHYHSRFGIRKAAEIKKWEKENVGKVSNEKIVGGSNVDISQVPYQAGLVIQINWFWQSVCGASLISDTRLVTAAHCWRDGQNVANSFTVVLGSNYIFVGGVRVFTTDVVMYPDWNPATLYADIAIIRISPVSFSNVIQPVSLPAGDELSLDFTDFLATASGFGLTSDGGSIPSNQLLSAVDIPVLNPVICRSFYGQWFHENNICTNGAGGRGTCQGDSGGPLVITVNNRRVLIGATSYGSWFGCQAGDPAAFARITSFANWIWNV